MDDAVLLVDSQRTTGSAENRNVVTEVCKADVVKSRPSQRDWNEIEQRIAIGR